MAENKKLTEKQIKEKNEQLSLSIIACLDLEQAFKLYSFRVISTDEFISKVKQTTKFIK